MPRIDHGAALTSEQLQEAREELASPAAEADFASAAQCRLRHRHTGRPAGIGRIRRAVTARAGHRIGPR
jgi:hypothetical protein